MSTPLLEQVRAALGTVNDPEIKRPITDLGMVDAVEIGDDGSVRVTVLLTVAATYPPHEHEQFLAHFRGLVGLWASDQLSTTPG